MESEKRPKAPDVTDVYQGRDPMQVLREAEAQRPLPEETVNNPNTKPLVDVLTDKEMKVLKRLGEKDGWRS